MIAISRPQNICHIKKLHITVELLTILIYKFNGGLRPFALAVLAATGYNNNYNIRHNNMIIDINTSYMCGLLRFLYFSCVENLMMAINVYETATQMF